MSKVVCPECEGEGTVGPGFVYTEQDVEQDFGSRDEFDEHLADIRAGVYDRPCPTCKGLRVIEAETAAYLESAEYQDLLAMERAERAFGC